MKVSSAKENILKKIRQALTHSTPLPFPQSEGNSSVFQPSRQELEIEFAEQFTKLLGKFVFCVNIGEMIVQMSTLANHMGWKKIFCKEEKLQSLLRENGFDNTFESDLVQTDVAITSCEFLIARTGSILMSSAQQSGRT